MDAEVQGAPVEGQERLRETINQFVSGLPVEEKDRETWMSTITQDLEMNTVHNRLRETLDQLVSRLKGQQEFTEILNQLVDGFNQLMSTTNQPQHHLGTSSEAKDDEYASDFFSLADVLPHREMDNGIKDDDDDDEYATVYFCPASDACWYAIPLQPREQGDVLAPVFREPSYTMQSTVLPFTLGPYLVIIILRSHSDNNPYEQARDVFYIDVKKRGPIWWREAPTFIGSVMCLFFVANYKLYGLECGKDDKISLKFLDFHSLEEGWEEGWEEEWQSTSPKGYISPNLFSENVFAFMLQCEEDSNTSSQVPVRTFIYTHSRCICYDFTLDALSLSKEVFNGGLLDVHFCPRRGVFVGSTMYILVDGLRCYRLMAYNHDDANSCLTQVTGLEKGGVFPSSSLGRATLLHLGKSRLCIIWCCLTPRRTTEVHCTKFDVYENQGKHFAKIVSTELYNVFADYDFGYRSLDALACCSKTTAF